MKKIVILLKLLVSLTQCIAQTVANDKMNILYYGVPNPLSVSTYDYPCKAVTLRADVGEIKRYSDGGCYFYEYYAPRTDSSNVRKVTFGIYAQTGKKQKLIAKRIFRLKEIPPPDAYVGNRRNDTLNMRAFKAQEGMIARISGFDIEAAIKVDSFCYVIMRENKVIISGRNEKNVFTSVTVQNLSNAKDNDMILFYNIFASWPNKKSLKIAPFELRLTP